MKDSLSLALFSSIRAGHVPATRSGFSLIEIVIAIGILSFGLVAVLGLLPAGLSTYQGSQEESQAIQNLNSLAMCIQAGQAVANGGGSTFAALAPFGNGASASGSSVSNLTWTYGGAETTFTVYLDGNGNPITSKADAAEAAFVRISPPADAFSLGNAYICIVWPGRTANVIWNGSPSIPSITPKQGYVETTVFFRSL